MQFSDLSILPPSSKCWDYRHALHTQVNTRLYQCVCVGVYKQKLQKVHIGQGTICDVLSLLPDTAVMETGHHQAYKASSLLCQPISQAPKF